MRTLHGVNLTPKFNSGAFPWQFTSNDCDSMSKYKSWNLTFDKIHSATCMVYGAT